MALVPTVFPLTFYCQLERGGLSALWAQTLSRWRSGASETPSVDWWRAASLDCVPSAARWPAAFSEALPRSAHPPVHSSPEVDTQRLVLVSCIYAHFQIFKLGGWCVCLTLSSSMLLAVSWRVVSSLLESSLTHSSLTEARSANTEAFSARAAWTSSSKRDIARASDDTWASYACRAFKCWRKSQAMRQWKTAFYCTPHAQSHSYLLYLSVLQWDSLSEVSALCVRWEQFQSDRVV